MATTISFNWELFHPSVRPEWLCGLKRQIPSVNSEAREHFHCFFPPNCSFKSFHHVSWHLLKLCPLSTLCFTTRGGKIWPPDISIPSAAGTLSSRLLSERLSPPRTSKVSSRSVGFFFFSQPPPTLFVGKTLIVVHRSQNHQHSFVLRPQEVAACFRARSDTAASQTVCGSGGSKNMSVG